MLELDPDSFLECVLARFNVLTSAGTLLMTCEEAVKSFETQVNGEVRTDAGLGVNTFPNSGAFKPDLRFLLLTMFDHILSQ